MIHFYGIAIIETDITVFFFSITSHETVEIMKKLLNIKSYYNNYYDNYKYTMYSSKYSIALNVKYNSQISVDLLYCNNIT